ncbi:MAG: GDSL-type esterase/lipase family protein [Oscillospiraceae bacterium]|nr:GDSL-type esterase/lipase family protein [Oscillospiraceae bacterium]
MATRKPRSGNKSAVRARTKSRKAKTKQPRRGPVMRFKFGHLIMIWILSLIACFGKYVYDRNMNPDKDVFVKSTSTAEDSSSQSSSKAAVESSVIEAENSQLSDDESTAPETPDEANEEGADSESEPLVPEGPKKTNPVPESEMHEGDYLKKCAFLGETNVYLLGQNGWLAPLNVYASENLRLTNYTREYIMLNGTTIRILSAINAASCPIYLMFGTESLFTQPTDQTAEQFKILMKSVMAQAPEAPVYVMAIPPVTYMAEFSETPLLNSTIDDYNSRLLDLCNEENIYFIDTNTALKNNDGKLDPTLAEEDGIHLNADGGRLLLEYVLNHVPPAE